MEKSGTNTPPRVSASEFLKSYGALSRRAEREPLTITNHRQESLVLVSAEEFKTTIASMVRSLSLSRR